MTRVGPTGVVVTSAEPNTAAWYEARHDGIGSSEIAAVLGISPWTSPFDLYWQKLNREVGEPNEEMSWGTRLEPVIADAFEAAHCGEFGVEAAPGVIMHVDRHWQRCSPDRLIVEGASDMLDVSTIALLECKSDNNRAGWGEPGTDQIPAHYLAQVRWQLDTIGLPTAYVAVTFGGPPVEYVIEHDEADAKFMRKKAREFLDRLQRQEPPPLDAHNATTQRLKILHPDVDGSDVPVEAGLIAARRDADERLKSAEADRDLLDNEIRAVLGNAQYGYVDGVKAVTRSVYDVKPAVIQRDGFTVSKLIYPKPKKDTR